MAVKSFFEPLETPAAIGKVERAEGIMKAMLRKTVNDAEAVGEKDFAVCLHEALVIKNQVTRTHVVERVVLFICHFCTIQ